MSEFEERYKDLVSRLRVIEMIKAHYADLILKKENLDRAISNLKRKLWRVREDLDKHQKSKTLKALNSYLKERYLAKENQLKEEFLSLTLQIKEREKLIRLIQFEMDILDEKSTEEEALKKQLSDFLQELPNNVSAFKSEELKSLITTREELQGLLALEVEFEELIEEGNQVLNMVYELRDKFQNDLIKEYKLDSLTPPFRVYCSKVIDEIQVRAVNLKYLLESFSKEYADVYQDEKWNIEFQESKNLYYNTLSFGELIIKRLSDSDVSENVRELINQMSVKVIDLNKVFQAEVTKIQKMMEEKESKLNRLLKGE